MNFFFFVYSVMTYAVDIKHHCVDLFCIDTENKASCYYTFPLLTQLPHYIKHYLTLTNYYINHHCIIITSTIQLSILTYTVDNQYHSFIVHYINHKSLFPWGFSGKNRIVFVQFTCPPITFCCQARTRLWTAQLVGPSLVL